MSRLSTRARRATALVAITAVGLASMLITAASVVAGLSFSTKPSAQITASAENSALYRVPRGSQTPLPAGTCTTSSLMVQVDTPLT